jgi:hypothetical protein
MSYQIRASVYTPADDTSVGGETGRFNACSIAIDILGREPKSALEALTREYTEPGPPAWPAVLGAAFDFSRGLCESFLSCGYLLRVDLPADQSAIDAPDTPLERPADLDDLLSRLSAERRNGLLYPVHIWGLERANAGPAMKAIDSYRVIRFDESLAQQIIDLGCFRLELSPEFMALWFPCGKLSEMRTLLKAEAVRVGTKMDWKDEKP